MPDSGSSDSGTRSDASGPDGGDLTDAGLGDTGFADASIVDATARDADFDSEVMPVDARVADSGPIDSGPADTGAADSGLTDSGGPLTRYGFPDDLGGSPTFSPNYLLGHAISVTTPTTLRSFGVRSRGTADAMFQATLYTDVAGAPGALVAQTALTPLAVGSQEVPAMTATALTPGTYWLLVVYDSDVTMGGTADTSLETIVYIDLPFGTPPPAAISTPMTYTGAQFNYWIVGSP